MGCVNTTLGHALEIIDRNIQSARVNEEGRIATELASARAALADVMTEHFGYDLERRGERVMGCDIAFIPERRPDDGWEAILPQPRELLRVMHPYLDDEMLDRWCDSPRDKWSAPRNYHFFARLADVRNYGDYFEDGQPVEPLYPDRGVPDDASHQTKHAARIEWGSWFGHTWATLRELMHEALVHDAGDWYPEFLQLLTQYCRPDENGAADLDSVRVVFWFDN